jgi:hypothetical protein
MACLVLEVVIVLLKWMNHLVSPIRITMAVLVHTTPILVTEVTILVTVLERMVRNVRGLHLVLE